MDTRRARRLASAASQAQVEMAHDIVVELETAFGQPFHQVNPAARRIHLGAGQQVGRAGFQTKTAMDTVEQQVVIDYVAQWSMSSRSRPRRILVRGVGGRFSISLLFPGGIHYSYPTKHPGLKIPAGSKAVFRRRISASAPAGGASKYSRQGLSGGAAASSRRWPRA